MTLSLYFKTKNDLTNKLGHIIFYLLLTLLFLFFLPIHFSKASDSLIMNAVLQGNIPALKKHMKEEKYNNLYEVNPNDLNKDIADKFKKLAQYLKDPYIPTYKQPLLKYSLLSMAVISGNKEMVDYLISKAANKDQCQNMGNEDDCYRSGFTPLLFAMITKNQELSEHLIREHKVNVNDQQANSKYPHDPYKDKRPRSPGDRGIKIHHPLYFAIKNGWLDLAIEILEQEDYIHTPSTDYHLLNMITKSLDTDESLNEIKTNLSNREKEEKLKKIFHHLIEKSESFSHYGDSILHFKEDNPLNLLIENGSKTAMDLAKQLIEKGSMTFSSQHDSMMKLITLPDDNEGINEVTFDLIAKLANQYQEGKKHLSKQKKGLPATYHSLFHNRIDIALMMHKNGVKVLGKTNSLNGALKDILSEMGLEIYSEKGDVNSSIKLNRHHQWFRNILQIVSVNENEEVKTKTGSFHKIKINSDDIVKALSTAVSGNYYTHDDIIFSDLANWTKKNKMKIFENNAYLDLIHHSLYTFYRKKLRDSMTGHSVIIPGIITQRRKNIISKIITSIDDDKVKRNFLNTAYRRAVLNSDYKIVQFLLKHWAKDLNLKDLPKIDKDLISSTKVVHSNDERLITQLNKNVKDTEKAIKDAYNRAHDYSGFNKALKKKNIAKVKEFFENGLSLREVTPMVLNDTGWLRKLKKNKASTDSWTEHTIQMGAQDMLPDLLENFEEKNPYVHILKYQDKFRDDTLKKVITIIIEENNFDEKGRVDLLSFLYKREDLFERNILESLIETLLAGKSEEDRDYIIEQALNQKTREEERDRKMANQTNIKEYNTSHHARTLPFAPKASAPLPDEGPPIKSKASAPLPDDDSDDCVVLEESTKSSSNNLILRLSNMNANPLLPPSYSDNLEGLNKEELVAMVNQLRVEKEQLKKRNANLVKYGPPPAYGQKEEKVASREGLTMTREESKQTKKLRQLDVDRPDTQKNIDSILKKTEEGLKNQGEQKAPEINSDENNSDLLEMKSLLEGAKKVPEKNPVINSEKQKVKRPKRNILY